MKSLKAGKRQIPMTKKNLPNLVHLSSTERKIVKDLIKKRNDEKKEILTKEWTELFKQFG